MARQVRIQRIIRVELVIILTPLIVSVIQVHREMHQLHHSRSSMSSPVMLQSQAKRDSVSSPNTAMATLDDQKRERPLELRDLEAVDHDDVTFQSQSDLQLLQRIKLRITAAAMLWMSI